MTAPLHLDRKETLMHHATAWGAALGLLAAWWHGWTVTAAGREWPLRLWPGHLLIDAVQVTALVLLGLAAGGWWWWAAGRTRRAGAVGALILLGTGAGALAGEIGAAAAAWMGAGIFLWGAGAALFFRRRRAEGFAVWWRTPRGWNAGFFVCLVLLNTAGSVLMVENAPAGWLPAGAFILTRLLTQLVVACALWLLLWLGSRWWPRCGDWCAWGAVMLVPLVVAADVVVRMAWTKDLHHLCAEMASTGRFDLLKVREGTGIGLTAGQLATGGLIVLAAPALFLLMRWISRRAGWRMSGARLGLVGLTGWVLLMALNMAAVAWQPGAWRQWESRTGVLHVAPFAPSRGLVSFDVEMANPKAAAAAQGHSAGPPDVFFFIVETLRDDAIAADRAPFLTRWKAEECQPLGETRSASNATHLSWFSMLHGRLPCYVDEARAAREPAPLLSLLHGAGYALEVRSAGNFDYEDMFRSCFGDGSRLRIMEHVPEGHPDRGLSIGERERRVMARLREAVSAGPPGGVFRLTTLDTPHYPYRWHEEWTPPFTGYEESPVWPLRPNAEELDRVRRRYANSVAWCDHLLGEFIAWLKAQGRYDGALIIVTGDHGEEFKEHGSWWHCSALNTQQTRVPILVKWPASMGRGPVLTDASHLDLLPGILDAAGVPAAAWQSLPGRSLRRAEGRTSILNTTYNAQDGEAMVWRREGWEAAFSWFTPMVARPPARLWLERLEGPDGEVSCDTPEAWEAALRSHFPDAFERLFLSCRRTRE